MPLLRFTRSRRSRRAFPALPAMPSVDARQIEHAMEHGRARMESLVGSISAEGVGELLDELRRDAAPIIERATGRRRRSRKPRGALTLLGLGALAAAVAYLLWPRCDEEPAYLMTAPDRPTPTPAAPAPSDGEPRDAPAAPSPDAAPARELARHT